MSLRGLLMLVAGAAVALALASTAALVVITSHMGHNSVQLWQAVESVRVGQQIEIALLRHIRERRQLALTQDPVHTTRMEAAELELRRLLADAQGFVGTPAEAAVLRELEAGVDQYLQWSSEQAALTLEQTTVGNTLIDKAVQHSESLIQVNLTDARAIADEARMWDRLSNQLGGSVVVALFIGVAWGLWSLRRSLYQPLMSLRGALVRFRPGAAGVVAPEIGPLELREIAREFNHMAERLKRHREAQLRFIAGVAHDLRNPLSALKLSTASARPDRPLPPEEKVRERFALVARQVDRLERMVGDLLDTARIETGALELRLEEHDLRGLVLEAVDLHRGISEEHELLSVLPETPVPVRGDATRISQVLNNLLNNAIKYSPQGGPVRVELTLTPSEAWVMVKDSGVGIPASERETIFEPFRRSTGTRDTIPGVGLGLSVARRIIEAHGGRIEVESTVGAGSTFRFSLPRSPAGTGEKPLSG